jgi:hypothetical protein
MTPRLFVGGFSGAVYLSTRYKDRGAGQFEAITKTDITEEFENVCLAYLAKLAGEDGHKYLADGLIALVEKVNGRQ